MLTAFTLALCHQVLPFAASAVSRAELPTWGEFLALLERPVAGRFHCVTRTESRWINESSRSEAKEHCLRAMRECRDRVVHDDYIPAAVRSPLDAHELEWTYEELAFDGAAWESVTRYRSERGEAVHSRLCDGEDLVITTEIAGSRSRTQRYAYVGPLESTAGVMLRLARLRHQLAGLAEVGQGGAGPVVESPGTETSFVVDTRGRRFWDRFVGAYPVHGVLETSSSARVTMSQAPGTGSALALEWSDCFGFPVMSVEARWVEAQPLPVSITETRFVPGTATPVRWAETLIGRMTEDGAVRAWEPESGELIEDRRYFGKVARYEVGADGTLLPDDQVVAAAEAQVLKALATDAWLTAGDATAQGRDVTSRSVDGLVASPGVVELGKRPIGARVPVRLAIANGSAKTLQLGELDVDCGCLEATLSNHTLRPGRSVVLSARQEIQRSGEREVSIRVPVYSDGDLVDRLELMVRYEGSSGAIMLPRAQQLGVIQVEDWPQQVEFRILEQGCGFPTTPTVRLDGDLAGECRVRLERPGVWLVSALAYPATGEWLGALEGALYVDSPCEADGKATDDGQRGIVARITATAAPHGEAAGMPSRVVVSPDRPFEFVLPRVAHEAVVIESTTLADLRIETWPDGDGTALRFQSDRLPTAGGTTESGDVWVRVEGQRIRLRVFVYDG